MERRQDAGCSDLLELFREGTVRRSVRLVELSAVRRGAAAVCEMLSLPDQAVVVADAETDADLATLAQAAVTCRVRLLCGSAGLARALADVLLAWPDRQGRLVPKAPVPSLPLCPPRGQSDGPVLVVAGSRHPRTARQVEVAQRRGAVVVRPDRPFLRADGEAVERMVETTADYLARGRDVILTTIGLGDSPLGGQAVADRLAQVVRNLATEGRVGRLVFTGGDIAAAACTALEASALWLRGETQPGIPWGVLLGGVVPSQPVVTKAGGFGTDDALAAAIDHRL